MPATAVIVDDKSGTSRPLLRLEHGTVRMQRATVLRNVDLSISAGEVIALSGANGSGKSTLLHVLAGLIPLTEGRFIRARPGPGCGVASETALVAHDTSMAMSLTLRENLELVANLLGRNREAVTRSLERVGLTAAADRPFRVCSQGMGRRAELARVLLTAPQLLLLDEAHAALDVRARRLVAEIARAVAERNGAAVVVTHDLDGAGAWCDRVLEVRDGRVRDASW